MKKLFFLLIFLGALYWGFYQGTDIPLHTESHSNAVTSEHKDFKTDIKTAASYLHTYFSKNNQTVAKSDKDSQKETDTKESQGCLLYTSPSPRDRTRPRMPSSA